MIYFNDFLEVNIVRVMRFLTDVNVSDALKITLTHAEAEHNSRNSPLLLSRKNPMNGLEGLSMILMQ